MSRLDSARIAAFKAQEAKLELAGSVAASDAFFPFRDGLDALAAAGATAVIQPGGSVQATPRSSRRPMSAASRWSSPGCDTSGH